MSLLSEDLGIELPASPVSEHVQRSLHRQGGALEPDAGHRVDGGHDAGSGWDRTGRRREAEMWCEKNTAELAYRTSPSARENLGTGDLLNGIVGCNKNDNYSRAPAPNSSRPGG